jgi:hypothetical protein
MSIPSYIYRGKLAFSFFKERDQLTILITFCQAICKNQKQNVRNGVVFINYCMTSRGINYHKIGGVLYGFVFAYGDFNVVLVFLSRQASKHSYLLL